MVSHAAFTPDGKLAITADNGNSGRSDGHIDTVTVIDLEANPPRSSQAMSTIRLMGPHA
ncbi:MAG TPA: hypothetical protein VNU21_19985 [Usitatibacter sp.]|nr:hypothetical protein [Usitatibacter sp.]